MKRELAALLPGGVAGPPARAVPRRPALGRRLDGRHAELSGRPLRRHAPAGAGDIPPVRHGARAAPVPAGPRRAPVARRVRRSARSSTSTAPTSSGTWRSSSPATRSRRASSTLDPREDGGQPAVHGRPGALPARYAAISCGTVAGGTLAHRPPDVARELPETVQGHDRTEDRTGRRARSPAAPGRQRAGPRVRLRRSSARRWRSIRPRSRTASRDSSASTCSSADAPASCPTAR